jgi:hypothetical protein
LSSRPVEAQRYAFLKRNINAPILGVCHMAAMHRKLVWVERPNFQGWACTECAWVFTPSGTFTGRSLYEMKENYERERDKEFRAHVCAGRPRPENRG